MKTLYEQLGVTPLACPAAIQESYFRLSRKLGADPAVHPAGEHARSEYLAAQNAYRTLSNLQLRAEYGRSLVQSSWPTPKK